MQNSLNIEMIAPGSKDVVAGLIKNQISPHLDMMEPREMGTQSINLSNVFRENRDCILYLCNSNAIDPALQRIAALHEGLTAFVDELIPLAQFCALFNRVPLEGTDQVGVPYYPLATGASNSWDQSVGYASNLVSNTAVETRTVAVGGSGSNSGVNAAANTAKDRKWRGIEFSSLEYNREPFVSWQQHVTMQARQLARDIFSDIISRCVTAATFGSPILGPLAPASFSGDNVAALTKAANTLKWPVTERSLIIDSDMDQPLISDPTYKQFLAYPPTDLMRQRYIQNAYKFRDISSVPGLASFSPTGEHLLGWIAHKSALLVATSPIMPSKEVRQRLARYEIIIDPITGLSFEYRRLGLATVDAGVAIIESSYGGAPGRTDALRRITSN